MKRKLGAFGIASLVIACGAGTAVISPAPGGPSNDDASAEGSNDDAGIVADAGVDAREDAGAPRELGVVVDEGAVDCATIANGAAFVGFTCRALGVTCEGADPSTAIVATAEPTAPLKGTIVTHAGGPGNAFLDQKIAAYRAHGFRVVAVAWATSELRGWEDTGAHAKSIKVAACRPATVFAWAFDHLHGGRRDLGFCGEGFSGGSGAMTYALATYGIGAYFDYVMLTQGPPFGRMDCGCDPSAKGCAAPALCPQIASPAELLPDSVAYWEGLTSKEDSGACMADGADLARLEADSVAAADGTFAYPKTRISAYYCASSPNGTTGGGAFYLSKVTPAPTIHCSTTCAVEQIYDPDNRLPGDAGVTSTMLAEMDEGCVPRH